MKLYLIEDFSAAWDAYRPVTVVTARTAEEALARYRLSLAGGAVWPLNPRAVEVVRVGGAS